MAGLVPPPKQEVERSLRGGVRFRFDFGLDPNVARMYREGYETEIVQLMEDLLGDGDVFFDVGANIGYMTAVALGLVGRRGQVHAFEPVPEYCNRLRALERMNREFGLIVNEAAAGDGDGDQWICVSRGRNIGWNTMVEGLMEAKDVQRRILVKTVRLDNYAEAHGVDRIRMIKIDVEGYELRVLAGLTGYFERTGQRPIILCEIAPTAYPLIGAGVGDLAQYLDEYGYRAYYAERPDKEIDLNELKGTTNAVLRAARS